MGYPVHYQSQVHFFRFLLQIIFRLFTQWIAFVCMQITAGCDVDLSMQIWCGGNKVQSIHDKFIHKNTGARWIIRMCAL